jgi:hypothetical protein
MLSIGGWLSWQAVRALVPWASPLLAYGLAALASVGLLILYGYHLGSDGKAAAVAERDLEWVTKINEANNQLQALREAAKHAADRVPPTPHDRAARLRLCAKSPTCRKGD